jgi:hypothetical protein
MMMMLMIGLAMSCFEATNECLKTTGWMDFQSGYRFLMSTVKNEGKNVKKAKEAAKEEVKIVKEQSKLKGNKRG